MMRALVLAVVFASGWYGGYELTKNKYQAEIATDQSVQAQREAATAEAHTDELRATQALADVLSQNLSDAERHINQLTLEKSRAIPHYTTGAVCFGADLTRLLNAEYKKAIDYLPRMPSTAIALAAEGATAAEVETLDDTSVAHWINQAKGQYETCRARLNALVDFERKRNENDGQ